MRLVVSTLFLFVLASVGLPPSSCTAGEAQVAAGARPDLSMRLELEGTIGKGLDWLAAQQSTDGAWSQAEYPAITALVLTAFQGDPSGHYQRKHAAVIDKGYQFLLANVKPDGGIYAEKLANYNTSISLMALLMANDPSYEPVMKQARQFVIGLQDRLGEDVAVDGGIGYGGSYQHSDLANTSFALEAIHFTRYLQSDVATDAQDLDWNAARRFISRTQNLPGTNDQPWASDDPDNKGGFIYFPGDSKAGEQTLADGRTALRSYGSMSYAGLLSLIYAEVDKDDPRVKAAVEWLSRNYTLDENPGMGQEGLFYYYHTMAKALSAAGIDTLTLQDGTKVSWRQDLAKRLLNLQSPDGSWMNENGRWMERDPNLVTAYAVITLEIIQRGL